jgi:hypothetical protein
MMDEGAGICSSQTTLEDPRTVRPPSPQGPSGLLNIVLPRLALWFMPRPARGRILVGPSVLKSIPPSGCPPSESPPNCSPRRPGIGARSRWRKICASRFPRLLFCLNTSSSPPTFQPLLPPLEAWLSILAPPPPPPFNRARCILSPALLLLLLLLLCSFARRRDPLRCRQRESTTERGPPSPGQP